MISSSRQVAFGDLNVPGWVPEGALHYLAHTELGQPIRALARMAGCHASTILRQIRRIETRRDDPLVDAALRRLGATQGIVGVAHGPVEGAKQGLLPDQVTLEREALRVLRRLCETGSVLAVAAEMEKAVVVRDTAGGGSTRTAVVPAAVAQAMALKEWIAPANTGRIVRYHITTSGRAALTQMLKDPELLKRHATGFEDAQTPFDAAEPEWDEAPLSETEITQIPRSRQTLAESPLVALSRRRDHKGKPFLSDALVCAGELLREDFELAQMGSRVTQDWDRFLTAGTKGGQGSGSHGGDAGSEARKRVAAALSELGPGLSDVVMRCCCYLEGLETTEKRLGWSARSGKVVLRIALLRLQKHYESTIGPGGPMIG
ncbi:MAG: DUF6456 domain-containing protein [Sulfitobacter sp.]